MKSTSHRLHWIVLLKRLPPLCSTRWFTSTAWKITSRTLPTMASITTAALKNRLRPMGWSYLIMRNMAGPSQARLRSCWISSSSRAGRTSRWVSGWHGRICSEQATAAKPRAAVKQAPQNHPKQRAAPGGGYARSAELSFAAPRKYGSSVPTVWSCS